MQKNYILQTQKQPYLKVAVLTYKISMSSYFEMQYGTNVQVRSIHARMQRSKDETNLIKAANLHKILQAQLCLTHDKFGEKIRIMVFHYVHHQREHHDLKS
jgi:hypothetical protein